MSKRLGEQNAKKSEAPLTFCCVSPSSQNNNSHHLPKADIIVIVTSIYAKEVVVELSSLHSKPQVTYP